jgi:DeoR family transcriptional regulator, copper-sensing transcriptional repressor
MVHINLMQPLSDRQQHLIEWLKTCQLISIEEVKAHFGISQATAYRDIQVLIQNGQALKVNGGVRIAPESEPSYQEGRCFGCGGTLNERTAFVIQMQDGAQRKTCCAHCGLLALKNEDVHTALASDFLYGHMINARQAFFVLESNVNPCCSPSVLCFLNEEDAFCFQKGFNGQVCNLGQAIKLLEELMHL